MTRSQSMDWGCSWERAHAASSEGATWRETLHVFLLACAGGALVSGSMRCLLAVVALMPFCRTGGVLRRVSRSQAQLRVVRSDPSRPRSNEPLQLRRSTARRFQGSRNLAALRHGTTTAAE
jgi:hypothetical protein